MMNLVQSLREALEQANTSVTSLSKYFSQDISPKPQVNLTGVWSGEPESVHDLRKSLAEAAEKLSQLSLDPTEYLDRLAANNQNLICLRWLVNLGVLELIPLSGQIEYSQLAVSAGVPESQLKGIARMAITNGFLREPEPNHLCHSPNSALLVTDPSFMNWARFLTNYSVPSAYKMADATAKWGSTQAKTETAFNLAMDFDKPFFEYLRVNPDMNQMFSSYMRNVASTAGISFKHLVSGFDWASLAPGAKVVDVGGSLGHASAALAAEYPHLKFVVQDLPETIATVSQPASGEASGAPPIEFKAHDFFQPQPIQDADVYLLRMIIHDWPDNEAVKILGHLQAALQKPGARIVIMDTVLPQSGTVPLLQERQLRVRDLTMMEVFNAKERELEDWHQLLSQCGLEVRNVVQPSGSVMGLLEVVRAGADDVERDAVAKEITVNGHHGKTANGVSERRASQSTKMSTIVNGLFTSSEDDRSTNGTASEQLGSAETVLIVGGGIGGLCLAQGLEKQGIDFLVFERDLSEAYRPQGYRLKLEGDAAAALQESLPPKVYRDFETSCAISTVGETDFDPISGSITKSRAGGGLAGQQGLRATYTVDRSVFRNQLMSGIEDKIIFGKDLAAYKTLSADGTVLATFKDGTQAHGRFIVGADGTRSAVRKQHLPDHKFVDTGAICIYGKTTITPSLLERYPQRATKWMTVCADNAPLIQSILIGDSPLTLLSEPIRFDESSRKHMDLPDDYIYWVLIGRKEIFAESGSETDALKLSTRGSEESSWQSLELTKEWHPTLRSLFELQDVQQCSTLRVVSATPEIPAWTPSANVTVIGDAIHAMSPCGGVGANTALRDAAELARALSMDKGRPRAETIGAFEDDMRKRAFRSLMRSYAGSKKMFDQRPFGECALLET